MRKKEKKKKITIGSIGLGPLIVNFRPKCVSMTIAVSYGWCTNTRYTSFWVYFIVRSTVFSTSFSIWWNYTWCSYFLPPYLILNTRALAPLTFTSKDQDDYFSNITHESDYLLLLQHYPRKRLLLQHYPRTHVKIQLRNTFHFTIPGIHLFPYEQSV